MSKNRFFLVKESQNGKRFPVVTIRDRMRIIPATIDGRTTHVYAPISDRMDYLEAYPLMNLLNKRGIDLVFDCHSVVGGWQSGWFAHGVELPKVTFGPSFNEIQDLWNWQSINLPHPVKG